MYSSGIRFLEKKIHDYFSPNRISQFCNTLIILGLFTTDHLEREFGMLRMGCGGAYYISAQQVAEKTSIEHGKLALQLEIDIDTEAGHQCSSCDRLLSEKEADIFSDLCDSIKVVEMEKKLDKMQKEKLFYIAGFIQKNDVIEFDGCASSEYYEIYGGYFNGANRGSLTIPADHSVQWVFNCYMLFLNLSKENICRKSLSDYFIKLADNYEMQVKNSHVRRLSNTLLHYYCKEETPRSSKEVGQKSLKFNR